MAKLDYPQKVKRVIFLFMNGGLSHVDCFDPKPMLEKYDGQPLPGGTIKTASAAPASLMEIALQVQEVRAVRDGRQ